MNEFEEYDERNVNNPFNKHTEKEFIPRDEPNSDLRIDKPNSDIYETKRISISKCNLKSVLDDLKIKKNLSLNQISKIIGTNIKNLKYDYTRTLKEESFQKLERLYGNEISHEIIEKIRLRHKNDQELAEFIGIMLGDGHINSKLYRQQISFNGIDENKYMHYVKNKIILMYGIKPNESWERDKRNATGKEKGMLLYIDNKSLFEDLISHGLKPGNKTKNQVSVPNWIKSDENFTIACLRGLFDTDGSISVVK